MSAADVVLLAHTLRHVFTSPNVLDSNLEEANIVDALDRFARAVDRLAAAVERSVEASDRGSFGGR